MNSSILARSCFYNFQFYFIRTQYEYVNVVSDTLFHLVRDLIEGEVYRFRGRGRGLFMLDFGENLQCRGGIIGGYKGICECRRLWGF